MAAVDLVADFLGRGRHSFTTADARAWLGVGPTAARVALARLQARKAIASPFRGYYVIVPPEYRALGCLPGEQFVPTYLELRGTAYYVALLSAARIHGAGHQAAQVFQVMLEESRRPLACGRVRVQFVTRRGLRDVPTMSAQTDRGTMRVSTCEATLLDLVGFPRHAGGLDNVATIVHELVEKLDGGLLAAAAAHAPIAWSQRLGYLLELLGAPSPITDPLAKVVRERSKAYAALSSRVRTRGRERNPRWRILVNTEVHPEA